MRKLKLLLATVALLVGGANLVSAQSWIAPSYPSGVDPESGQKYLVKNVGSAKFLDMGKAWFSWSTTAILSDNGIYFTLTPEGQNWKFIRTGTQGVFTSGNGVAGDAMHVDNTANAYGITKLSNGFYHIHDSGGDASSLCWGYNSSFHATGVVAHANANTEGWNCEWEFISETSVALYEAKVKLYNEYQKATAEGISTDDAATVYNNSSATADELNTATAALHQTRYEHQLAIASNDNPRDITEWVLTNPNFSTGNIDGWETNYVSGTQATNIGYQNNATYNNGDITISQFIEAWRTGNAPIGDGYLRQTVSGLPEGKYFLDCDAIAVNQGNAGATTTGALLFITADGSDYTASLSTGNGVPQHFSTQFLFSGEGNVIFGLKTVSTTANWIAADNFKVTFYGIDLSAYATQLDTETATFAQYESSIEATAYNHLEAMVDDINNASYTTSKTYAAAIANVQAINTYAAALISANAIGQTAKMNVDVLSALQTEIGKASTVTLDGIATATTDLTTATANATASIANYVEAKAVLDAANIYDDAGKASYAADETIVAIQSAYDNGTLTALTQEEKDAARVALANACKAQVQPADGCDMTAYIVNPGIDGNVDGWTTEKKGNTGGTGGPLKPSNDAMEYWGASTLNDGDSEKGFDYYQTITSLPEGAYTISAVMLNSTNGEEGAEWNGGGNAGLYGKTASDEVQKLITENGETFLPYTTDEILVIDGTLRIGVKNIAALTGRWFAADNFKLTYVRQLTDAEKEVIAKEHAIAVYNTALVAAQAVAEGTIPSTAYTNLQSTITANTLEDGTSAQYTAAAEALTAATEAATPLVAPYAAWKALKPQADNLATVSTSNDVALSDLSTAIGTQNSAVEGATAAATITDATSALKTAMVTYVTTAEPTNDECFDLTFMIVNPHFTEGTANDPTGWTATYPEAPENSGWHARELRAATHNFEAFRQQFTLSQTISGLKKGTYKVTLQGFARHDGEDKNKTNLFCGIVNQPIKEISAEYSTVSLTAGKPALGDNNGEHSYQLNDQTVYQPNGMSGSYYYFQEVNPATEQPFYTNEVQTLMTDDGDLQIGFKCETWTDWVIWDNFHLYYYGSAINVTIDENVGGTFSEDIENANVTLNRTIKAKGEAGIWNTIVLPFSLTADEVENAFGDDVEIANYAEVADGNESSISFTIATDKAITANKPVLLRTSTEGTSYTFNGVTIVAGEPIVTGEGFFDFVGTYAAMTTIAAGDYFLSSNKLYKSAGSTTIKGTRAYIKAKDETPAEARVAKFFIDGVETTNIDGLVVEGADNGKIYNLNGQEVKTPKAGLYIQNGKKIIVK